VEFQRAAEPVQGWPGAKRTRIGFLLEGFPELDELRRIDNGIIETLPGTIGGRIETLPCGDGEIIVKGLRTDPEPAVYGRDVWLHYHSLDDVGTWSEYFHERLLRFMGMFERGETSAVGEANVRFHAMIGRVQAASTPDAKQRILREFVEIEPDPHYSQAAANWLDPSLWANTSG
jgi:hypothetical protein